jgi:hypothetical protein
MQLRQEQIEAAFGWPEVDRARKRTVDQRNQQVRLRKCHHRREIAHLKERIRHRLHVDGAYIGLQPLFPRIWVRVG